MEQSAFRALLAMGVWSVLCMVLFISGCVSGEVGMNAEETVPGCVMTSVQDPLRGRMTLQTYAGRTFLVDASHLGWDIHLPEGQAVYPIGCGTVRIARAARGYGTLGVVVEHRLAAGLSIRNGAGDRVFVDRFLSIYGHMRPTSERGGNGENHTLRVGDVVSPSTLIGYVENRALNGDGVEHLHLGVRLQSMTEAMQTDPTAWFRGYDATPSLARWFVDPQQMLAQLRAGLESVFVMDAGLSALDAPSERIDVATTSPALDVAPPMDGSFARDLGSAVIDIGNLVRDTQAVIPMVDVLPPNIGRDVVLVSASDIPRVAPDIVVPAPVVSRIRYEFRVRSALRVTAPFRLHDEWWRSVTCLNTGVLDPFVTPDGFARCDAERLTAFDGSVFLPDHPDWGDRGQIGTVANTPERCTPVQGAEWRITDLTTNRLLFAGLVSGLRCVSYGSQDRLQLP